MSRKVIVTGIGLVTAIGQDKATTWENLLQGKSGIERSPIPDRIRARTNSKREQSGCLEIPAAWVDRKISAEPRAQRFMRQAVKEAIADAGLDLPLPNCGVAIGSSRGCQRELEQFNQFLKGNWQGEPPPWDSFLNLLPSAISAAIASDLKTESAVLAPMAACATANWAIAQAYELIQTGQCDMAIAGTTDAAITELSIAGFQQLGVLAKTGAYPFSIEREGLVLGEGAAALVLESSESALKRGSRHCYGQILGFGLTNDACHPTSPSDDYQAATQAVQSCLQRAGLSPQDVGYINAHGTATKLNDAHEAELIGRIFSDSTYVSGTKGATGHALGATGMMEAAFCLLALRDRLLPPCVGLQTPAFDLNLIASPKESPLETTLSFSFGFGGQNAVVAFGRS
ncbi:beta-ketoacyl-ACP synthase [Tumidithrix elongata RA019]|uniref:Beta-ketoacyl-ACP synthase n=1 Tax=Tumidithrix elongata BACA0141 TaxID=2716417 RepID=A0AAW9Q7Q5_9CYAN|nr:beta-ketoacyl-ACP synthase [Tumidithrix elongata RA019]